MVLVTVVEIPENVNRVNHAYISGATRYASRQTICDQIFSLHRKIRSAAILDKHGKISAGRVRDGVAHLDKIHERRWLNQLAIQREMSHMFDKMLGRGASVIEERELVKHLVIYSGDLVVLVIFEPEISTRRLVDVRNSVLKLINS